LSALDRTTAAPPGAHGIAAEHGSSRRASWTAAAPFADTAVLYIAVVVEPIGDRSLGTAPMPTIAHLLFPPLALVLLWATGLYRRRLRYQLLDDFRLIVGATAIATMATVTLSVLAGASSGAVEGVRLWLFATVYLAASRAGVVSSVVASRRRGEGGAPTLIVGAGHVGRLVAKRLVEHPELGLRPVGFLDKEPRDRDDAAPESPALPVLGASWDLLDVIGARGIQHVVVTFSTAPHDVMLRLVGECTRRGVHVTLVPRLFEKVPRNLTIDYLGGLPLLTIDPTIPQSGSYKFKYLVDRVAAAVALVLLSPLLLVIGVGVLVSLGRPILFRQVRIGCDGRAFEMLKFRSMRAGPTAAADSAARVDVAPGGVEGDDRRTALGTVLRRTSLDELPQLLNVLRGEMSLIGPRPERPEFVRIFAEHVYRYDERHRVKSGITGWAQVNGLRGKTSLADRVEWDNWYIENCSPWLDLKIALKTLAAVVRSGSTVE
jgi:exopolysaccharide biosynthesis polyprenyl glycosylphosphotransferase